MEPSVEDEIEAITFLDSIADLIIADSLSFTNAAIKFSDDPSKTNGGILVNTMTGNSIFPVDQLDPTLALVIDKLEVGDVSEPIPYEDENGDKAFRIISLVSRTKPHIANLKEDYNKNPGMGTEQKTTG